MYRLKRIYIFLSFFIFGLLVLTILNLHSSNEVVSVFEIQQTQKVEVTERSNLQVQPIDWIAKLAKQIKEKGNSTQTKKILIYDSFKWWNFEGWDSLECPVEFQPCQFTENQNEIGEVDAAVFARDSFHSSSVDNFAHNYPELKIICYILEFPYASYARIVSENTFLGSYWRGSDIWVPYGKWVYDDPNVRTKALAEGVNYAQGKTGMAAIVVSNCGAQNKRLDYVKELQKYISVDVYGACSSRKCRRGDSFETSCFHDIGKTYKFYLSFENCNCRDYATEKFFMNALQNNIVPVVLGAHRQDLLNIAPEHSYIHVEDFVDPKSLADFLLELNTDDDLYNEYFQWKSTGKFVRTLYLCQVCAMLQIQDEVKTRLPVGFEWKGSNTDLCLPRKKWYWEK